MKSLLFPLSFCIAVSAAAAPTEAQGSVNDGSVWRGGGVTIAMDIGFTSTEGVVTAQAISASGWSNTTTGTAGDNHSDEHASCDTSGVMTVPTEEGMIQVKCDNGRVKRKDGDTWRPMYRVWGSAVPEAMRGSQTLVEGQLAPWDGLFIAADDGRSMLLGQHQPAPWTGTLYRTGEEVVSLPLN